MLYGKPIPVNRCAFCDRFVVGSMLLHVEEAHGEWDQPDVKVDPKSPVGVWLMANGIKYQREEENAVS